MTSKIQIIKHENQPLVVIPENIFMSKQNIDWQAVENYLRKYIGNVITIAETKDIIYIGTNFPPEYKGSKYTKLLKGANAKAKANASQGILQMINIAANKRFRENKKKKHQYMAENGWYYYSTRFAIPLYKNEKKTDIYNIYSACLLVNHAANDKLYLYDLVDIKKEASTPLKTNN